MIDLAIEVACLKALGRAGPNKHARVQLENALSSKWEGIQSVGVQALGAWGDKASKLRLRSFLAECRGRPHGWAIRGVIVAALVDCLDARDSDWILDLYFGAEGILDQHEIFTLAIKIEPSLARNRVINAAEAGNEVARFGAATLIANMDYVDRNSLLNSFLSDKSPRVVNVAQYHLQRSN